MKCYLSEVEVREREGKVPFLICKWVGIDGDTNAEKVLVDPVTGKKRLNIAAAKARRVTLNKSVFALTVEDLDDWLQAVDYQVLRMPNEEGNLEETKTENKLEDCTEVNLKYIQVPLSELKVDVKEFCYYTSANVLKKQNFVTVIGFADENDVWAESQTPAEMALSNFNTNMSNGTYFLPDEVEEEDTPIVVETKEEAPKPATEAPKKSPLLGKYGKK